MAKSNVYIKKLFEELPEELKNSNCLINTLHFNQHDSIVYYCNPDIPLEDNVELNFAYNDTQINISKLSIRINTHSLYHFTDIRTSSSKISSYFNNASSSEPIDYSIYEFISSNMSLKLKELEDILKLTYDIDHNSTLFKEFVYPLFRVNEIITGKHIKNTIRLKI